MVGTDKEERDAKRRKQNGMDSTSSDSGLPDWASKYKSPVQNWFVKHRSDDDDDDEVGSAATEAAGPSTSKAPAATAAASAAAKVKKTPASTSGASQLAATLGKRAGHLFQGNNLATAKQEQDASGSKIKDGLPLGPPRIGHKSEREPAGEAMAVYDSEFATQEISQEMTQGPDQGATAGGKTIAEVLGKSEVAIMMPDRISRNKVLIELSSADDNQAVDLSGDSGAVGRVQIVGKPGSEQLRLDLKGMLFSGTVLALPGTAFVLNIGSSGEAKVEMLVHDFIRLKEERGGLAGDAGTDGNLAQYMDDDDTYQLTDGPNDGTLGAPAPDKAKTKASKPKKSSEHSAAKAGGKLKSKGTKKPAASASASAKRLVSGLKASTTAPKRKRVSGDEAGGGKASTPKVAKPSSAAAGSSKKSSQAAAPASAKAKPKAKPSSKGDEDSDEEESDTDGDGDDDDDDEDF